MVSSKSTVYFFKSLLIATILTITIVPILLLFTGADTRWVFMATILWTIGSLFIFHPFILYVYPHLMSKISLYLLTSLLIIVSTWFNITMITLLLPYDYIYYAFFNSTLSQISILGSIYIIIVNAVISNFALSSNIEFYKEESLF